ncbi:MAG: hypothetical protein WDM92_02790 [Caulobacteraceae bacterium]
MDDIAQGKGKGPTPFMKGGRKAARADAVWNSNRADGEPDPPAKADPRPRAPRPTAARAAMPKFIEPQLTRLVDRPPAGAGWAHEIKFDGYRLQLRVEGGKAALRTRKGLDWTDRFPEIAKDGARLAEGIYDGEAVALDAEGKPDFAGLQAALSSGKTEGLVFYLFDALFAQGEDLRELPLRERKARLKAILDAAPASPRLRYVDHFESAGDAVLKSPAAWTWRASSPSAWTRPTARAGAIPGPRPSAAAARRWWSPAGPPPETRSAP